MRYHLICELNRKWNVAFGSKRFEFGNLKYRALLALDECQTLQEVKNLMKRKGSSVLTATADVTPPSPVQTTPCKRV